MKKLFQSVSSIIISAVTMSAQNIPFHSDSLFLDEAVVIGMGTQKRNTITAAVSTVTAEAVASRPVTDLTSALQGNVAGLGFVTDANSSGVGGDRVLP